MKKITVFSLISFFLFYLIGCMEEKGTYERHEINEVTVSHLTAVDGRIVEYGGTNGTTPGSFTIGVGDVLTLVPEIAQTFAKDESNLEFCWWNYEGDSSDTLSYKRNCEWIVDQNPGTYTTFLVVTDKETGLFIAFEFELTVVGVISQGLLVLSDVDGVANVGFLSASLEFSQDVYEEFNNGAHAGTNPVSIKYSYAPTATWVRQIYILCKDATGGSVVSSLTFENGRKYKDYFYLTPNVIKPEEYWLMMVNTYYTRWDFLLNNGRLYGRELVQAAYESQQAKFNPEFDGDYYMSNQAIISSAQAIFYDNKNYRFLRATTHATGTVITPLDMQLESINTNTDPAAIAAFDPDNVGLEMLFIGSYPSPSAAYCIMRDPNDHSKLYRLKFLSGSFLAKEVVDEFATKYVSYWKTPITSAGSDAGATIGEASSYVISKSNPYIYYSHDSKIYRYDVEYGINREILDVNTIIPNSQVDKLYIQNSFESTATSFNYRLYAASSEKGKSGKNGSVYRILLNQSGEVEQIDNIYKNVVGRVVGMDYKY